MENAVTTATTTTTATKGNLLYSVYGARLSRKGDRVNVSLVCDGNGGKKTYATISVKIGESVAKTKAVIKNGKAYLEIPLLTEKPTAIDATALDDLK